MSYNGYRAIARVYDRLNDEIDYHAWADFIEGCFDRFLTQRPTLVLDLACGTGSMALELAARGYDVIGIDGSADMLSEAYLRNAGRYNILWLEQDMRSFELYGTVGAVTCCLDSLNYLLKNEELCSSFRLVWNYLDPGGLFLFDMNTPHKFETTYGDNAYVLEDVLPGDAELSVPEAAVYCGWQNHYDAQSRICRFELSLFEESADGTYRRHDEVQEERCYEMDEILQALAAANLELLAVWGDDRKGEPTPTTGRWHFAARAIK